MDFEPPLNPPPARSSKPSKLRLAAVIAGAGIVAVVAIFALTSSKTPEFVWLSAKPFPARKGPSVWSTMRLQIIKLTFPVWRHFYHHCARGFHFAQNPGHVGRGFDGAAGSGGFDQ
jgi:hypothetical protein